MPELPEVETSIQSLRPFLEGERITDLVIRRKNLRKDFPSELPKKLIGSHIISLSRRAKYGLIETSRRDVMVFHLGMSGRWRVNPPDLPAKHDHLLLKTEKGDVLALNDPRRFGFVDLFSRDQLSSYPPFVEMGPEPLGHEFDHEYLTTALAGRKRAIKTILLDQKIVAGLGNIYVCEALNMAGISPFIAAGEIEAPKIAALVAAIKQILIRAIRAGGSSLRDFARPDGELGYFAHQWRVYGREDEACLQCDGTIARIEQGGRSTFWCSQCQS